MKHYLATIIVVHALQSHAAVERVGTEFSGSGVEDWESFSRANVSGLSGVPLPIFGGTATISGQNEFIWISCEGIAEPSLGCFGLGAYAARSHDGEQGYGTGLAFGASQITFNNPVYQFGAVMVTSGYSDMPSPPAQDSLVRCCGLSRAVIYGEGL
jgi:hypothetical protein